MGSKRHLLVIIFLLVLFLGLAAFVFSGASASLDTALMLLAPSLHGTVGDALAVFVGDGLGVFGLASLSGAVVLWLALGGRRLDAVVFGSAMLFAAALMTGLKLVFARARPELFAWLDDPSGFSFPSGHALTNATFWLLLAAMIDRRSAWVVGLAMALFAAAMRVVAGVHWPTDVAAGLALGAAIAAGALLVRRRLATVRA